MSEPEKKSKKKEGKKEGKKKKEKKAKEDDTVFNKKEKLEDYGSDGVSLWVPMPTLPCPGKYEDINKEAKSVLGTNDVYDGVRFEIQRGLSQVFTVQHAFSFGSQNEPPTYNFGASWIKASPVTNEEQQEEQSSTVLFGRVDTDGHLMGRIIGYYPPFRFTTQLQLVNEEHQSNVGFDMDYAGPDYHLQAKWLAPGSYGMSYFQSITKNWAAGCDLFYNYKQSLTVPTLGTRYVRDKDIFSAVFTYGHLTVSYAYRMSNRVTCATELTFQKTRTGWESTWSAGVEYPLRLATFKANINSAGKITGVFDQFINSMTRFSVCGELDHGKQQYRFGLGLNMAG